MAQPVWVLSVDLQTKTAVFQSGMSDAAKAAKGSFQEIKDGAASMGRETSGSMMEARHGVMLLGEEFGVRLPRALTTFIASIGPVGAAMSAAFPFLAIVVGATLLLEHLAKLKEAGEKLTESQRNFGTTVANVLNALDNKLLEAGIRADELNHDHIGALHKQLELIDHQSLKELSQSFDEMAKAADVTMAQLKTSWYQFGAGSAGAKHALEDFKSQYDELLAQGKDKEAHDLLAGTKASAEKILELQKQAAANQTKVGTQGTQHGDYAKYEQAKNALKQQDVALTEQEVEAQKTLVDVLQAQVEVEEKVAALKKVQDSNATQETKGKVDTDSDNAARQQAEALKRDLEEADKLREEAYKRAVAGLETSEREKIDATRQGSAARLAAINAAIKDEESKGLQETGFYRDLLTSRVNNVRQMAEEQAKVQEEAAKESAEHDSAMARLRLAADEEADRAKLAMHRATAQQLVAEEVKSVNDTTQLEVEGYNKEIAALDKYAADYTVKLKALQDKIAEIEQQGQNKIQAIQDQALQRQMQDITRAYSKMSDDIGHSLTQVLTRHETASKAIISFANQAAAGLMENALKAIIADDMTKPHDAAAAARKAFLAGEQTLPGIPGVILGGVLAAGAFASVMAFDKGGIVPGVENFDAVNAVLTPGEAVLPKALTEQLTNAAKFGKTGSGPEQHVHIHANYHVHAMDGESVHRVLEEHADTFHQHFENHVRKMNH